MKSEQPDNSYFFAKQSLNLFCIMLTTLSKSSQLEDTEDSLDFLTLFFTEKSIEQEGKAALYIQPQIKKNKDIQLSAYKCLQKIVFQLSNSEFQKFKH